jgi:hypothetical protein
VNIRNYAYYYLKKPLLENIGKCQLCSSAENLVLHHKEYKNNKESVMLVCKKCHNKIHSKNNPLTTTVLTFP